MIDELMHIQISSAYICCDCEAVGNCATQCPACASEALLCLGAVLNRRVDEAVEETLGYIWERKE